MMCMNCDYANDMEIIYENGWMKEFRCPQCGESAKWYFSERDNGDDTIELHICPNCVAKMESINGTWRCPRCRTTAYEGDRGGA